MELNSSLLGLLEDGGPEAEISWKQQLLLRAVLHLGSDGFSTVEELAQTLNNLHIAPGDVYLERVAAFASKQFTAEAVLRAPNEQSALVVASPEIPVGGLYQFEVKIYGGYSSRIGVVRSCDEADACEASWTMDGFTGIASGPDGRVEHVQSVPWSTGDVVTVLLSLPLSFDPAVESPRSFSSISPLTSSSTASNVGSIHFLLNGYEVVSLQGLPSSMVDSYRVMMELGPQQCAVLNLGHLGPFEFPQVGYQPVLTPFGRDVARWQMSANPLCATMSTSVDMLLRKSVPSPRRVYRVNYGKYQELRLQALGATKVLEDLLADMESLCNYSVDNGVSPEKTVQVLLLYMPLLQSSFLNYGALCASILPMYTRLWRLDRAAELCGPARGSRLRLVLQMMAVGLDGEMLVRSASMHIRIYRLSVSVLLPTDKSCERVDTMGEVMLRMFIDCVPMQKSIMTVSALDPDDQCLMVLKQPGELMASSLFPEVYYPGMELLCVTEAERSDVKTAKLRFEQSQAQYIATLKRIQLMISRLTLVWYIWAVDSLPQILSYAQAEEQLRLLISHFSVQDAPNDSETLLQENIKKFKHQVSCFAFHGISTWLVVQLQYQRGGLYVVPSELVKAFLDEWVLRITPQSSSASVLRLGGLESHLYAEHLADDAPDPLPNEDRMLECSFSRLDMNGPIFYAESLSFIHESELLQPNLLLTEREILLHLKIVLEILHISYLPLIIELVDRDIESADMVAQLVLIKEQIERHTLQGNHATMLHFQSMRKNLLARLQGCLRKRAWLLCFLGGPLVSTLLDIAQYVLSVFEVLAAPLGSPVGRLLPFADERWLSVLIRLLDFFEHVRPIHTLPGLFASRRAIFMRRLIMICAQLWRDPRVVLPDLRRSLLGVLPRMLSPHLFDPGLFPTSMQIARVVRTYSVALLDANDPSHSLWMVVLEVLPLLRDRLGLDLSQLPAYIRFLQTWASKTKKGDSTPQIGSSTPLGRERLEVDRTSGVWKHESISEHAISKNFQSTVCPELPHEFSDESSNRSCAQEEEEEEEEIKTKTEKGREHPGKTDKGKNLLFDVEKLVAEAEMYENAGLLGEFHHNRPVPVVAEMSRGPKKVPRDHMTIRVLALLRVEWTVVQPGRVLGVLVDQLYNLMTELINGEMLRMSHEVPAVRRLFDAALEQAVDRVKELWIALHLLLRSLTIVLSLSADRCILAADKETTLTRRRLLDALAFILARFAPADGGQLFERLQEKMADVFSDFMRSSIAVDVLDALVALHAWGGADVWLTALAQHPLFDLQQFVAMARLAMDASVTFRGELAGEARLSLSRTRYGRNEGVADSFLPYAAEADVEALVRAMADTPGTTPQALRLSSELCRICCDAPLEVELLPCHHRCCRHCLQMHRRSYETCFFCTRKIEREEQVL